MSLSYFNRINEEEEFWKDVLDKPKKKKLHKTNIGVLLNKLTASRRVKFDSFLDKYKPNNYNNIIFQTKREKIQENVDKMLLKEKKKAEGRKRNQEEQKENKEKEEIQKCTFKPNINQYTNKNAKTTEAPQKKKNTDFYGKSLKWINNLKEKRAQKKQQIEYNQIEYTFRPQINNSPLAAVFNKIQLEAVLPQNIYFLNTKENNKKKRLSASTNTLPKPNHYIYYNDLKNKSTFTSRSRSLHCSIDVLKNELRSIHNDNQYKENEDE